MYTPMPMIENQYNISSNHLMKVSQQLVRLGYIESKHGRSGGLRLIKDPRKVIFSFHSIHSLSSFHSKINYLRVFNPSLIAHVVFLSCLFGRLQAHSNTNY